MTAFLLSAAFVLTSLLGIIAVQGRLRGFRFRSAERDFFAKLSRLDEAAKRRVLARAEGADERRAAGVTSVEDRLGELLGLRWQAMRAAREFDFVRLEQDLARLLRA